MGRVQAHKSTAEFFEMALGLDDPTADPFPPLPICQKPSGAGRAPLTYALVGAAAAAVAVLGVLLAAQGVDAPPALCSSRSFLTL